MKPPTPKQGTLAWDKLRAERALSAAPTAGINMTGPNAGTTFLVPNLGLSNCAAIDVVFLRYHVYALGDFYGISDPGYMDGSTLFCDSSGLCGRSVYLQNGEEIFDATKPTSTRPSSRVVFQPICSSCRDVFTSQKTYRVLSNTILL